MSAKRTSLKTRLATAIAEGQACRRVGERKPRGRADGPAWAAEPDVRTEVESFRRTALDQAVGRMAKRVAWATERIAHLADNAKSESVRLAAVRSILSDIMAISDFTGLEERIAGLKEQDRVLHQQGTSCTGRGQQASAHGRGDRFSDPLRLSLSRL